MLDTFYAVFTYHAYEHNNIPTEFTILVYFLILKRQNIVLNTRDQYCYRSLFPRLEFLIIISTYLCACILFT